MFANEPVTYTIPASTWQARDTLQHAVELTNTLLDGVVEPTELSECFHAITFNSPEVFGQFMMEHLRSPLSTEPEDFPAEDKIWWAKVAEHMGADYISKFRKVAAWMEKFDSFK